MPQTLTLPYVGRPDPLRLIPYSECRDSIHTGMLALFSGPGEGFLDNVVVDAIERITNSAYYHSSLCGWENEGRVLLLAESTTPESRVVTLSSRIRLHPGSIDLYQLRPEIASQVDFSKAWEFLLRASGTDYPEAQLAHDWLTIRGLDRGHEPNSDDPETRRVCSQLVHAGLRVAGMPPIRERDCEIYPATLADPGWFQYVFSPTV